MKSISLLHFPSPFPEIRGVPISSILFFFSHPQPRSPIATEGCFEVRSLRWDDHHFSFLSLFSFLMDQTVLYFPSKIKLIQTIPLCLGRPTIHSFFNLRGCEQQSNVVRSIPFTLFSTFKGVNGRSTRTALSRENGRVSPSC